MKSRSLTADSGKAALGGVVTLAEKPEDGGTVSLTHSMNLGVAPGVYEFKEAGVATSANDLVAAING